MLPAQLLVGRDLPDITRDFVQAGGYGNQECWTEEGWAWVQYQKAEHPRFWVPGDRDGEWRLRCMVQEIPMPWNWPVEVNQLEAKAFCNWKAAETGEPVATASPEETVAVVTFWQRATEILAILWLLTLVAWWWSSRSGPRKPRAPREPREPPLHKQQAQMLKTARKAAVTGDTTTVRQSLLEWGRLTWPGNAPRSIGELAARVDAPLGDELRGLSAVSYGKDAAEWDGTALAKRSSSSPMAGSTPAMRATISSWAAGCARTWPARARRAASASSESPSPTAPTISSCRPWLVAPARGTVLPAVEDNLQMQAIPRRLGKQPLQVAFRLLDVLAIGQSPALGQLRRLWAELLSQALHHATRLASRHQARLVLVHINPLVTDDLHAIPGNPPNLLELPDGCRFRDRLTLF